jgi:alpha-mannosidase
MRIKKLDHLLARLRERIFTPLDAALPLRFRRGLPEERSAIVAQDPMAWEQVESSLVWGEPESYFWFATSFDMPEAAAGQRVFLKVNAQFGNTRGRSDPQCLVRVNGRIAQGVDGNHQELLLSTDARPGERFDILLEAGTIEDRRQYGMSMSLMLHDPLVEKVFYACWPPTTRAVTSSSTASMTQWRGSTSAPATRPASRSLWGAPKPSPKKSMRRRISRTSRSSP